MCGIHQSARIIRPTLIRDSQGIYWHIFQNRLSVIGDEEEDIPPTEDGYRLEQIGIKKLAEAVSLLINDGYIEEDELRDPFIFNLILPNQMFTWKQIKRFL